MRINLHPGLWMVEVTEDGWSAARMDPNTGLRLQLDRDNAAADQQLAEFLEEVE